MAVPFLSARDILKLFTGIDLSDTSQDAHLDNLLAMALLEINDYTNQAYGSIPEGLALTAAYMVVEAVNAKPGVLQEKLADYTIVHEAAERGYSPRITEALNRHRKLVWGKKDTLVW